MTLFDLALTTAADAIRLKAAETGTAFFMTTTPVDYLGADRAARARRYVEYVREGETFADVGTVARRLLPLFQSNGEGVRK